MSTDSPFARAREAPVTVPDVLQITGSARVREMTLRVPPDLAFLEGHFPGVPVVPGVVQLAWVMETARALAGGAVGLRRVEVLKFKALLRPGEVFGLRVELSPGADEIAFRFFKEAETVSMGRCVLGPALASP